MTHTFTGLKDVLHTYGLSYKTDKFFDFQAIEPLTVADWFKTDLEFSLKNRGQDDKEAFAAEFIIAPCLKEIWKRHPALSLFSHPTLSTEDLTVVPDYLVTALDPSGYKSVYKPLLLTVEAKNEKFSEGWMQAALQAVVCQKINQSFDIPIFAIVTTGDAWTFGKLERQLFTYHPLLISVQDIERLLGALEFLYQSSENATTQNSL